MDDSQQQWKNLFDMDVLKDSIQIVALFVTVYELLESTVVGKPKDFYTILEWDDKAKADYRQHVLSLYDAKAIPGINGRRKDIISSLLWLKSLQAIDDDDIQVFVESKKLRNTLAHQMFSAIADGGHKLAAPFGKMYALFCKIERWWILEVEIPISGDYKLGEIDSEGVMSGHMVVLQAILDMLANNSNANYKDVCEALGVPVK